ncbi:P-type conjugative transfer protein TrbJ [Allopusillimonas ginsengisoli]|uniref:P-type conjugative transfer protein TrbJ n=1 Tax=Allopusillimonas ginsengisoli TaxID=453575 RepID=UPI0039C20FD7
MNNMPLLLNSRRLAVALTVALVGGVSVSNVQPVQARTVYCSNCSTVYDQAREIAYQTKQLAEQVNIQVNTAKQYADAVRQAMTLPGRKFQDITNDLRQIAGVYNNARSLGRDAANLQAAFKDQFKGYDSYLQSVGMATDTMPTRYEQWSASGLDNARTAMEAAGINVSSFDNETSMLDEMLNRSSTAAGRMQAIQAGNEIAAQNVQQLQKLRDMLATQIQMQSNALAMESERMAVDNATRERMRAAEVRNSAAKEF